MYPAQNIQQTFTGSEEEEANAHRNGEVRAKVVGGGGAIMPGETGAGICRQERAGAETEKQGKQSSPDSAGKSAAAQLRRVGGVGRVVASSPDSHASFAFLLTVRRPRMSKLNRAGEAEREKQSGRDERRRTAPTRRWRRSTCGVLTRLPCQLRLPPHCAASQDE